VKFFCLLICIIALFLSLNSLCDNGLIGYWRFDEGKGNFVMDSSGNGIRGVIRGAKWIRGLWGNALEFDGKGGVVINSPLLDGMSELTVALWLYIKEDHLTSPLAKKDCVYRFIFSPEGDHFVVATENNPWYSYGTVLPFKDAPRGKCFFLAGTYSNGTLRVYLNGELVASRSGLSGNIKKSEGPLTLGLADAPNINNFVGKIDELRIYKRALSDEEIRSLYNSYFEEKYLVPVSQEGKYREWNGVEMVKMSDKEGILSFEIKGEESAIVNNSLRMPVAGKDFLVLKMFISKGKEGRVFFKTTEGSRMVSFPIKSDGKFHTYCIKLSDYKEWKGELLSLCLFPSDEKSSGKLRKLEIKDAQSTPPQIEIQYFFSDLGVNRAKRPVKILAFIKNKGGRGKVQARLIPCKGVRVLGEDRQEVEVEPGERKRLSWEVEAEKPLEGELKLLIVSVPNAEEETASYKISFTPPVEIRKASYIPEPQPVKTDVLIGAWNCPLWENPELWKTVLRDLWRVPVLGFYDELNPEVKDWEIKWAVEHGIQFFIFCWYRTNQGKAPIQTIYERPITEALYRAKFLPFIRFTIMWTNDYQGGRVSDENDLLNNLLPYWIETFFKHPSYLKIDNKPLLVIYRPEFLVDDLGSVENVRRALDKMREKCKEAGFDGLIIIGEYRGLDPNHLKLMRDMGLDYTSAYVWPVAGNPTPDVAIQKQIEYWTKTRDMGIIPEIVTVSMGWTGWQDEGSIWKLPPEDFKRLCLKAKEFIKTLPSSQLGSKIILIDNWNEFGEGHYIMPHRHYGFGYLDAIREVFSNAPKQHIDLIPQDLGLGPYEHPIFKDVEK
jgi:hypothetical protein